MLKIKKKYFNDMSKSSGIVLKKMNTLYRADDVYNYNFWYFISLKKDIVSSMLTFSNRSFILFVLKNNVVYWKPKLCILRENI